MDSPQADGPDHRPDHQRLTTLVGCIRGLVLEFDADARYLHAWADDPALLASPAADLIGKTIDEVLGAEVGAPFTERVARVHATGQLEQIEYPLEVNGVPRWFFADFKRVGSAESGMSVVMFARDITERHDMELALARSEELYRLAARATDDVLCDWDVAAGTMTWSETAIESYGCTEAVTDVAWWRDRVHPDDAAEVFASLAASLASDASCWTARYRFRCSDGTYIDIFDRAFIVRDPNDAPRRVVCSMVDVTHLNQLQAQLLRADRLAALGVLAAGVGHEINNPLTYILGNLGFALEALEAEGPIDGATRAKLTTVLTEAHEGSGRIAEIVKTLKQFTRGDDTEIGPVDVHKVLDHAIKMAENEIRHRARLVCEYGQVPPIRGTDAQLAQVILNLLVNATQAIEEGARERNEVRVETGVDDRGRVFISVSDTGSGIAREDLPRVFDPFFTTKPRGSGTGLGLSICHGIVESLGGQLTVHSEVGEGTTFTAYFDADSAPGRAQPPEGSIQPAQSRARVLVVDDDPLVCRVIERLLGSEADVVSLTSAREAVARLDSSEHFDVIFCDVMMPEMTGIDLYEALRAVRPDILPRIHFMTGGAFTARANDFLDSLENTRIDKPIDPGALRAAIAEARRRAGAHAA